MGRLLFRFVLLGVIAFGAGCGSRQPAEQDEPTIAKPTQLDPCLKAFEELDETLAAEETMELARKCSGLMSSGVLLYVADVAMKADRFSEGVFYYQAGKTRFAIDKQVFPTGKRGTAPTILLLQKFERDWLPTVNEHPDAVDGAVALFREWNPEVVHGYLPFWPSFIESTLEDPDEIKHIIDTAKSDAAAGLEDFSGYVGVASPDLETSKAVTEPSDR